MSGPAKLLLAVLLAGWLADLLAGKDRDVEAGIEAYDAGELEDALDHFDAAIERHGDRPELSLDRGLVLLAQGETDAARRAFDRASEAEDFEVRSSAFYELGNLALDAEDWDVAIAAYIDCLQGRPDHDNAKWNLEVALAKKEEEEEEEEDEEDEEEDEEDEEDEEEEEDEDTGGSDESGGTDDSGTTGGSGTSGGTGGESGEDSGTSGTGGDEGDSGTGGESGGQTSGQDEEPPSDDEGDEDQEPSEQPPPPALNQMDIDRALEELDEQDDFLLDRPAGRMRPPKQDW